jgi:hypothetical protein
LTFGHAAVHGARWFGSLHDGNPITAASQLVGNAPLPDSDFVNGVDSRCAQPPHLQLCWYQGETAAARRPRRPLDTRMGCLSNYRHRTATHYHDAL